MTKKRTSPQAWERIREHFGSDGLVIVHDHVSLSRVELARRRIAVAAALGECERCRRRDNGTPVPLQLRTPAQGIELAVITDNPLETVPRRVLVGALDKARVDLDRVAWIAVNACPARTPATLDEQSACHSHLVEQIIASGARYLLLAGAKAKSSWRYDLGLPKVAGRLGAWTVGQVSWFVYPVLGPADLLFAGSRGDKTLIREWEAQIAQFAVMASDDIGTIGFGSTCVECGDYMTIYDPDGMAWCGRHADKGLEGARKSRTKWATFDHPSIEGTRQ